MTTARHLVVVAVAESEASVALVETLRSMFTVRTAYDGEDLYGSLDESVDVVLVDPDLPGVNPAELADRIESRDLYCRIGILGSEPTDDPPELADAVLDEAAPDGELERVVARMAARAAYQRCLERLYDLATKRADLVTRDDDAVDEAIDDELARIESRIEQLRADIGRALDRLDDSAAFETALEHLDSGTRNQHGDGDGDGNGNRNGE